MKKINPKKLNSYIAYSIKDLMDHLGIDHKTVTRWIEDGLKIVEGSKKLILIMGKEVKDFLTQRQQKKKFKLKRSKFLCFHCRKPTNAKKGSIRIKNGKKLAVCRVCSSNISRTIKPRQKDYTIPATPT